MTMRGEVQKVIEFNNWLGSLPHRHKVVIAGNHDLLFETSPSFARSLLTNCVYLQDSGINLGGFLIYGSPWQPWFYDWAFNLKRPDQLRHKWGKIPDGVDILMTHGPPRNVLDRTSQGRYVGCSELSKAIGRAKPRLHCFGHIHEAYGRIDDDALISINASICDLNYRPVNAPFVIDL